MLNPYVKMLILATNLDYLFKDKNLAYKFWSEVVSAKKYIQATDNYKLYAVNETSVPIYSVHTSEH